MLDCPLPNKSGSTIQLAHGGGGSLTRSLVTDLFQRAFDNPFLQQNHDGAVLEFGQLKLAFTTDSYVVKPLFFPGGDIGKLAVCGTVNDLAMCGATPRYLSVGMIIEEGFPRSDLERVTASMKSMAKEAGVQLVTGDTKVVDHGKGDGIFINTAGIGEIDPGVCIAPTKISPGDAVILSGDIGRHGISILAARENLAFETPIESDCGLLHRAVNRLVAAGIELHCLRDLTRGGLATALKEIATDSGSEIRIRETDLLMNNDVRGAGELLGLDPLYVANEGRMIVVVPAAEAEAALAALREESISADAAVIGEVGESSSGWLILETAIGANRILDLLSGEQLPRIC